jgi:hypothetical protein
VINLSLSFASSARPAGLGILASMLDPELS